MMLKNALKAAINNESFLDIFAKRNVESKLIKDSVR